MAGIAGMGRPGALQQPVPVAPPPVVPPMAAGSPPMATGTPPPTDQDLESLYQQHAAPQAQASDPELESLYQKHSEEPGLVDKGIARVKKSFGEFIDDPKRLGTAADAMIAGADNWALGGYAPQVFGAVGAAGGLLTGDTNIKDNYVKARDSETAYLNEQSDKSPIAYGLGAAAGGAMLATRGGATEEVSGYAQAATRGAKAGAIWGALANPGDKEGEINPAQLAERMKNGVIGGTLGLLFGVGGQAATEGAEAISNTKAYGAVKDFFSNYLGSIKPDEKEIAALSDTVAPERGVQAQIKYALDQNEKATAAGIQLQPHELFPHDGELRNAYKAALNSGKFKEAQLARGDLINEIVTKMGSGFQSGGKTAANAISDVGNLTDLTGAGIGDIRDDIIEASKAPRKNLSVDPANQTKQMDLMDLPTLGPVQGGGRAENAARAASGGQAGLIGNQTKALINTQSQQGLFTPGEAVKVNATNLQGIIHGLREDLGFTNLSNSEGVFTGYTKPTTEMTEELAERMDMTRGKAALLVKDVAKISDVLANNDGKMTPEQLDQFRKTFQKMVDAHAPGATENPSAAFKIAVQLKDAFRDDFANAGKVVFEGNPEKMAQYDAFMERYSTLKQLPAGVNKLLDHGSQATNDMVAWFDKPGWAGTKQVEAFMQAAKMSSPEAAEAVGQAYSEHLFNKFAQQSSADAQRFGPVNGASMSKYLESPTNYSRLEAIVGSERASNMKALAGGVKLIQESNPGSFGEKAGFLKYFQAIAATAKANPDEALAILKTDRSTTKLIGDGALEKVLEKMKGDRKVIMGIYNQAITKEAVQSATQNDAVPKR